MKRILLLSICLVFCGMLLSGCAQSVEDVEQEKNIGKTVAVQGTVKETIKFGELSGYVLVDSNGDEIGVAAERLPAEGDKVTARGELVKAPLLGYYIDSNK